MFVTRRLEIRMRWHVFVMSPYEVMQSLTPIFQRAGARHITQQVAERHLAHRQARACAHLPRARLRYLPFASLIVHAAFVTMRSHASLEVCMVRRISLSSTALLISLGLGSQLPADLTIDEQTCLNVLSALCLDSLQACHIP